MKATILSGLPGSGKSTHAKMLNGTVVSADHFFEVINEDKIEYNFDPSKLPDAHRECKKNFISAIERRDEHIIVDNTNLDPVECAFYYEYADLKGYDVEVVVVQCDPKVALERQVHGVPKESHSRMVSKANSAQWPRYWKIRKVRLG